MTAPRALIAGINGTIGRALAAELEGRYEILGLCRPTAPAVPWRVWRTDYSDGDLGRIADDLVAEAGGLGLVISCVGVLHDERLRPEKRLADLDAERLAHSFHVNAVVPALLIKHFARLLPRRERAVFACLSAKLASIGDNHLGGWYGYRSSKAALNMLVRTASVELARTHRQAALITVHPGTTRSPLSAPFTARTPPDRLYDAALTARRIVAVIDGVDAEDSGAFFDWSGERLPW